MQLKKFKDFLHIGTLNYILGFIIILRIVFIGLMGPMPQDAYYFFYSQHLALSYFDHPPAIALILKFFTALLGEKVYVIKIADSLITLLSIFFFYRLSLYLAPQKEAGKSLMLFLSTLMVSVLSLVSTPDTPLILFWTISLLMFYIAIFKGKTYYWIWTGIFMGLAFDSKYTALFLPLGMVLFLLLSREHRKYLFTFWPWVSLIFFLITLSPVIIWNVQHDFASFRFQGSQRMSTVSEFHLQPKYFFGLIAHQSALLMPVIFLGFFYAFYCLFKKYQKKWASYPAEQLFLLSFFIPLFLLFFALSLVYWVKLNWMMPAYLSGVIWLSHYVNKKWLSVQLGFSLMIHLALAVELIFYPFPIKSDDTWVGWRELAKDVEIRQKSNHADFIFAADDYKTSAELNFYLKEFVYSKNVIGENALEFDYIGTDIQALKGKDALFIDSDPNNQPSTFLPPIPASLSSYFSKVTLQKPILIKRNGLIIRRFDVFLCEDYQPNPKIESTIKE